MYNNPESFEGYVHILHICSEQSNPRLFLPLEIVPLLSDPTYPTDEVFPWPIQTEVNQFLFRNVGNDNELSLCNPPPFLKV
jgi:hypothetical protein